MLRKNQSMTITLYMDFGHAGKLCFWGIYMPQSLYSQKACTLMGALHAFTFKYWFEHVTRIYAYMPIAPKQVERHVKYLPSPLATLSHNDGAVSRMPARLRFSLMPRLIMLQWPSIGEGRIILFPQLFPRSQYLCLQAPILPSQLSLMPLMPLLLRQQQIPLPGQGVLQESPECRRSQAPRCY